jgi:hypothetical protein
MLVPFVIDADSLEPEQEWSAVTLRQCHEDILDLWTRFGLLIHDGPRFNESRLSEAIASLPPKQRSLWQAMLQRSPPVPCTTDWAGSVTPQTAPDVCCDAALALVDNLHAELEFSIPDDEDETRFCVADGQDMVICRFQSGRRASVVREADALSVNGISSNDGYQDIWASRFRSLAATRSPEFKQVTIVDRYAMERHFNPPDGHQLSGLQRFLNLLDADAGGPRRVTLFSAWSPGLSDICAEDVEAAIDEIMDRRPRQMIDQITVFMIGNRDYGEVTADRYVRMGQHVWELGHGLEVFEGGRARQWSTATFKRKDRAHQCIEEELRRRVKPRPIKVKG